MDILSAEIDTLVSIIALIFAIIAIVVSWWYNRRSLYIQTFKNIIEQWHSKEFTEYRKVLAEDIKKLSEKQIIFPINHPPEEYNNYKIAMRSISHFFDALGARAYHKYVDKKMIYVYFGGTIINHWKILESYIRQEKEWLKEHNQPSYHQYYFHWLYQEVVKFKPESHLPKITK